MLQLILIENELNNSNNLSLTFEKTSFKKFFENKSEISSNSQQEFSQIKKKNCDHKTKSNKKKLNYKSDTILNIPIPDEKKTIHKTFSKLNEHTSNDYSFNENKNTSVISINNKAKQFSTSASNRKKINNESISKHITSKDSFTTSNYKSFNISEFDKNVSENKFEIRNSLRKLDRLFEENNLINFNMDDFNQLRISFSNQKKIVNTNNSSLGNNANINTNSFVMKKNINVE